MRYRKKPIVIEAIQCSLALVTAKAAPAALPRWFMQANAVGALWVAPDGAGIMIKTPEGAMLAQPSDMIIQGVAGELYPCKEAIFVITYEPVVEENT